MYSATIETQNQAFVNNCSEVEVILEQIQVDYSILPRECIDKEFVQILLDEIELKDRRNELPVLDPLHVFEIENELILARGLYRYHAYKAFKEKNPDTELKIPVITLTGTREDLIAHICTSALGEKPIKGYTRKEKRMLVENYLQLPVNRPPNKTFYQLQNELGIVTDKTIKAIWECAVEQPDGTLKFEEKSNVLTFPKQKKSEAKGFAPTSEEDDHADSDRVDSEFRTDYYDEDHGGEVERSLPNAPRQVNDVRPERERLQQEIDQLKQELQQANKELAELAVVRNERDDYKRQLIEMTAIANKQNNAVPLLEEIDKLNSQISALKAENEALKLNSGTNHEASEESKEKPHPLGNQLIKEIATMGALVANRLGSTSLATKIECLLEGANINPETIKEILEISEIDRIQELEQELAIAIQSKQELQSSGEGIEEVRFLLERSEEEVAKLQSELKLKTQEIDKLKKMNGEEFVAIAKEVEEMGGLEKLKRDTVQLAAAKNNAVLLEQNVSRLNKKIANFEWIQSTMSAISSVVGWSEQEKKDLISGKSVTALEKLARLISSAEVGGIDQALKKLFNNLGFADRLSVQFQEQTSTVIEVLDTGLKTEGGETIPWWGILNGHAKFDVLDIAF